MICISSLGYVVVSKNAESALGRCAPDCRLSRRSEPVQVRARQSVARSPLVPPRDAVAVSLSPPAMPTIAITVIVVVVVAAMRTPPTRSRTLWTPPLPPAVWPATANKVARGRKARYRPAPTFSCLSFSFSLSLFLSLSFSLFVCVLVLA